MSESWQSFTAEHGRRVQPTGRVEVTFLVSLLAMLFGAVSYQIADLTGELRQPRATPQSYEPQPAGNGVPFWDAYSALMTATEDYDNWFADVDAATHAIQIMFVAIPPPEPHEEQIYNYMKGLVELRDRQVLLAREEWRRFLDVRDRLVRDVVATNGHSRVHADEELAESAEAGRTWGGWTTTAQGHETAYLSSAPPSPEKMAVISESKIGDEKTKGLECGHDCTIAVLATTAHQITKDLVHTHAEIFKDWGPPQVHIHEALRAERALVRRLLVVSRKGGVWTTRHALALSQLAKRMDELQQKHEAMREPLELLQKLFPSKEPNIIGSEAAWMEGAEDLLLGWSEAYTDVQEGVLYMLRGRDVKSRTRKRYPSSSWSQWKIRNCGGTSCFDESGVADGVKNAFHMGHSVAEVAGDETRWHKSLGFDEVPQVRRDVYERACCEDGMLAHWLRCGVSQPPRGKR